MSISTLSSTVDGWNSASWTQALDLAQGLAVISPLSICVAFFSIIGTLTIGGSVLPQTIDTIKNKQTQSFAMLMYIFLVVGCFFLAIYGIGLVCAGGAIEGNYFSQGNIGQYTVLMKHYLSTQFTGKAADITVATNVTAVSAVAAIISGHFVFGAGKTAATIFDLPAGTTVPAFDTDIASLYHSLKSSGLSDNLLVTPGAYRNYQVNYTTPGGLLIIGEGFASLTSLVVLWIKVQNIVKAKAAHMTEAEFCTKLLEEIKAKKAMKGAH